MPPPKDRLAAMQQNADIQPGDDCEVGMDEEGPLKDFFKDMEEIKANVEKVNTKVAEVKKLQSEILNSPTVDKTQNQKMDDLMAEIKKLANSVRTKMKKIEQENETEEKSRGEVTSEIRIKKTQHMTTSRRFVEVMTEYNKVQTDYREASKEKIKRQLEISGKTATDEELEQMLEVIVETYSHPICLEQFKTLFSSIQTLEYFKTFEHRVRLDIPGRGRSTTDWTYPYRGERGATEGNHQ